MKSKVQKNKNILLPYENKWVALSPEGDKVVAWGKSVIEVDRKLKKKKDNEAVLMKVLPFDRYLSP